MYVGVVVVVLLLLLLLLLFFSIQYNNRFYLSIYFNQSLSIECSLWLLVASLVGTRLCR